MNSLRASDPFFVRGGDVGCLLIHGFSGDPADLRPLAEALAAAGYTVDLPLLPGHGPAHDGLGRTHWRDWVASVAAAHDELRRTCRSVVIAGYSMGGSLALIEAARRSPVSLVLLGVPTFVDADWRIGLLPVAKYVVRWWYPYAASDFTSPAVQASIRKRSPELDLDFDDPLVQQQLRRAIRIPTAALDQFFRLTRRARRLIGTLTMPALVVHGRRDETAVPVCAEEIYHSLASREKELAWFDGSGHQLVTGPEGPAVVERIVTWIGARGLEAQRAHVLQTSGDGYDARPSG